ncbi:hypothetical protein AWM70_16130 [Paenibacillus yonginensis]|uniref:Uncharacterized protein n=1 Tax=Paenibacillus yonginensis TaxID=1462996 RepID=A0A1B1N3F3_9BACL|nr:hypothetical protein [Paenibacillus yonginensis]ANS75925.1 hypothetical protein AWM70_16130 [Paenibacillus yonginensis]
MTDSRQKPGQSFEDDRQEAMRDHSYTEPQEGQNEHDPEIRTPGSKLKADKAVVESLLNVKEIEY